MTDNDNPDRKKQSYNVTLQDTYGTQWSTNIMAISGSRACDKAEKNAPGSGQAKAIYADNIDTGERYHAE